ncbi:MAG: PrsW family intramembrane metalloprotease [Bacteroidales bacterium]|nr:PrsW family intramembrane metalloprotease [Bacteroidales bacterium]
MAINYIISLITAPLIAIILFMYIRKKAGKNYYTALTSSFILGIISILLVVAFQYIASAYDLNPRKGYTSVGNLRKIIFYSFVVMGIGSELGKFLVLRYHCFTKPNFNGPLDSIVYSVMVAMGFAFAGNVLTFILPVYEDIDFTYAITVIFANLFFSVVLGFFVGLTKLRRNRFIDSMTGLFAAAFFHALYSFCFFTEDYKLLIFMSIGVFIVVILLLYKALEMNLDIKSDKSRN